MQLSFEFFPPKTDEQHAVLETTLEKLKPLNPEYVSVTFGAGGSTLDYTVDTIRHLSREHGLNAAPHLSCVGGRKDEIKRLLDTYLQMNVQRIVALRGDMPSGMATFGEFHYASDLVAFIRSETGDRFHIDVACYPEVHPQAMDANADLANLKRKLDAGANGAITQYFYSADAYFRLIDDAAKVGITAPIVPGIMPISNHTQLKRFSDLCGAEIPRWIGKRLQTFGDDIDAIREFGADVVSDLCRKLLAGGAPGLHFYTLNRAKPTKAIIERLNA